MILSILAYLDPGSGSFLFQLLIGTLVGALVLLKGYWAQIVAFFRKPKQHTEGQPEENGRSASQSNNQ